ncbi:MAG: YkgJ family cysteine cluster protein [Anaerolineae bacterium]|nr:YkgJ family cysteine cluster protein [Gloeobacterales cyanobacterium ES-bin-313]
MKTWQCVKQCGACCYLAPAERPFLEEYLDPDQLALYHALVGADGWCVHYQKVDRTCGIYETRPEFCRVNTTVVQEVYGEDPQDLDRWAIHCCTDHIDSVYGPESPEMLRFKQANL